MATLNPATQSVLDAAMELPEDERAELAAVLVDSIGDGRPEAELDAAWLAEAKRRLEEVRGGHATLVSTSEVEQELEELIEGASATRRAG